MKRAITLEAFGELDSGVLLFSVAMTLCNHRLNPESLVWNFLPEKKEVRVWLVLNDDEQKVKAFAEKCRNLANVRYLSEGAVEDQRHIIDCIRDVDTRSRFDRPPPPSGGAIPPYQSMD